MAVSMASKMGRFVDYDDSDPLGWQKYMRFSVDLKLDKPLRRWIRVSVKGGSKWIELKYERLTDFCYACGIFGHSFHNCVRYEDSIPESELPYGVWLRASPTRKRRGGDQRMEEEKKLCQAFKGSLQGGMVKSRLNFDIGLNEKERQQHGTMKEGDDSGKGAEQINHPFTWWNKQPEPNEIMERLDRGVASMAWMEMFPYLTVHHLPLDKSDHRPIKIACMTTFNSRRRKVKRFRFEDFWLSSPKCEDIVRGAWGQLHGEGAEGDVPEKIKRVSAALIRWNREEFGNLN
ncbi:Deoxyribose-phosphate aldolase [Bienertia sinuspersici]